jgi:phosphoribosylanthranilate isomerase
MLIKICGITNLEDARVAVEAGADALGFNFYRRSQRYIEPQSARSIIEQLPAQVLSVGVFVNEAVPEDVAAIASEAGVGAVQLHGEESPDYCRALKDFYVIKALRVSSDFSPEQVLEYECDAILLDAFSPKAHGGTGEIFDWRVARRARRLVQKLFLAGGLSVENIGAAIAAVEPYAVDTCSCLEISPGRKSAALVREFISAARAAC